jgi:hypothetical protein
MTIVHFLDNKTHLPPIHRRGIFPAVQPRKERPMPPASPSTLPRMQALDPGEMAWQEVGPIQANPPDQPRGRQYRIVKGSEVVCFWRKADRTWATPQPEKPLRGIITELIEGLHKGEWLPTAAQESLLLKAKDWAAVPTTQAQQIRAMYAQAYGVQS